jgi:dUTP pyrophosphatase
MTSTGLIDTGFTGTIRVRVYNMGEDDYVFKAGDKITQIVFIKIALPEWVQVDRVDGGMRGDNGYGSTGR